VTRNAADRIAEYVRLNPDATVPEVLRTLGLSPDHREAVEAALADEFNQQNPPEDRDVLVNGEGSDDTDETAANRPPEAGSPRSNPGGDANVSRSSSPESGTALDADFSTTAPDTHPPALVDAEQWMVRGEALPPHGREKAPYAPWADTDGARWGQEANRAGADTAREWADRDPRADGLAFIQTDADPFAFVDGDDVRDPDTGDVHPVFCALLAHLGATYTDVSTSGTGVHAYYYAPDGLPLDGKGQATFAIDTEPWGANDDAPTVEIYANKHVCVTTGDHVNGTPADARPWDADALWAILEANEYGDEERVAHDTDRDRPDLEEYDPAATAADETTAEVRDVLAAVDRLTVRDLPLDTRRTGEDATGWGTFDPSYRASESGASLHKPPDEPVFYDHKEGESFGLLGLFAAEQGILSKPWDRLAGGEWWDAVDAAREAGAAIPKYAPDDADPVAPFALGALDVLTDDDRERFMRKRGVDVPTTDEAREDLRDAIMRELRAGNTTVLDAPTALGKTHTVATEPWRRRADATGEAPVVHLHPTRDARDDAAATTRFSGATGAVLKGRKERCPVAAGDHDPVDDPDAEDAPDQVVTVAGEPASAWFDTMCDGKGLPFSTAHALARDHNDQDLDALPCCDDDGAECPAVAQWNGLPRDDGGNLAVDVIHATHQFLYVPSLRRGTNVILDERPDFTVDLPQDRIRRAVNAFLQVIDTPVSTFEAFVMLAQHDAARGDAANERDAVDGALEADPPTEWYVDEPDAHALAPDLTRAIWQALRWEDPDANGRRSTKVLHEPPRFDAGDGDGYAGVWLSVVIDDDHTVRTVRATPDLSQARAVIGLDAHPSMPMWELNAGPGMVRDAVLDPTERRLWRRYERGLTVVQVGDATRPRSGDHAREWLNDERVRTALDRLREYYGDGFGTAITTAQVEPAVRSLLEDVTGEDLDDEHTMHYGEEKSRNPEAFVDADAGYVYGCMDPGDDMILDALAELGLDAEAPRLTEADVNEAGAHLCETCDGDGCSKCDGTGRKREKGRTFDGPDADTAQALLASVRENHVAQAAGRYARDPEDGDGAVVFVHTDATPPGFADLKVPGVEWLATDLQREILEELVARPSATAREIAAAVGCSKDHVRETLARLEAEGLVARHPGAGDHGADMYREDGADGALLDLGLDQTADDPLRDTTRWSPAIWDLHATEDALGPRRDATNGGEAAVATADGADRPPDSCD